MNSSSVGALPWPSGLGTVVVHYDNFPLVMETIGRLIHEGAEPASIVLLDNSQNALLQRAVQTNWPNMTLLSDQGNVGYGAAVNIGMRHLDTHGFKIGLVLTHEVELVPGSAAAMHEVLIGDPGTACVAPIVHLATDRAKVWSAGGDIDSGRSFKPTARQHLEDRDPAWFDGCCFMLRLRDFEQVGGMYEPFFLYFEDVDLFLRLRAKGRLRIVVMARAYQEPGGMSLYYAVRNRMLLARRHGGITSALPLLFEHTAKALVEFGLSAFSRRYRARLSMRVLGLASGALASIRSRRVRTKATYRHAIKVVAKRAVGKPARKIALIVGTWGPAPLRHRLLSRLGVINYGQVDRGVAFENRAVRIESGAVIGRGCRFEGGAAITIKSGVKVASRSVVTTRVPSSDDRYLDLPVTVSRSVTAKKSFVAPHQESQGEAK